MFEITTLEGEDCGTNVVHLMRDVLSPCLACFHARDHRREFRADDCLGMKRFAKCNPLVRPSIIVVDQE
jgi:hypothetical protein